MGNLNRGPRKFLVNSLNQTVFGLYANTDGDKLLVDKKHGLAISNSSAIAAPSIVAGYGQEEVMEEVLLDLYAPYPSDTVGWVAELNITAVPRKQGTVRNHREITYDYAGIVESLDTASGVEVGDTDKLTAIKQIVQGINHDPNRFCNAGMLWVVTDDDGTDASTITITLENGVTKTITTVGSTTSLAAAINADTDLNPYIKAYTPSLITTGVVTCIIESIAPGYYLVEKGTDTTVAAFYVKLTQLAENVTLNYGGGLTTTKWDRVKFTKWTMDAAACVDAADDADFTIIVEENTTAINITTNTDDDTKALGAATKISTAAGVTLADNEYIAAIDASGIVTVVSVGGEILDIDNTAGTDLWDIAEVSLKHQWATLSSDDMAQLFPNLPGNEFQVVDLPDPNSRYFMLQITWKGEAMDNVTFDSFNVRKHVVTYYIKESLMPTSLADATKDYWVFGTNMMSDSATGADRHFAELINIWTGATTISDAILAG